MASISTSAAASAAAPAVVAADAPAAESSSPIPAPSSEPDPSTFPRVTPKHAKLGGYDFYHSIGSPKYVVAPMVDQSELPWRLLSKSPLPTELGGAPTKITTPQGKTLTRYVGGTHLSYTPMVHAKIYASGKNGQDSQFNLTEGEEGSEETLSGVEGGDRPLFVQFCANDPEVLLDAAKRVEDRCDAVDINFGCPQGIAKKGRYGSFLQDEWELIHKLISTLHENLKVPVTAKFRVFPDVEKTVRYAKMMEAAGAQIITCHGRTRDMKGQKTGLADWEQIKAVKAAVKIPVFANGNILYSDDVDACIEQTGVDGVMSAEGNLSNPAIFMPQDHALAYPSSILLALRYLDIVDGLKTRTAGSAVKAHMFRLLKPLLADDEDLRQIIARTGLAPEGRTDRYREALNTIAARLGHPGDSVPVPTRDEHGYRALPPHIAQPYIRKRPISSETALGEDGEAVPSTAGPSRVASPAPDAEGAAEAEGSGPAIAGRVIGGMDEMCVGTDCPGTAATRCPTRACLLHCREVRAVAAGMDPAAAAKAAAAGGLVGHGCDAHEAKHIARQQRRQEKNAARSQARAIKREETRVKQVEREEERRAEREERQRLKAEKESQKRKRSASPGGEGEHKAKASKEDAEEAVVNGMSEKATAAADAVAA